MQDIFGAQQKTPIQKELFRLKVVSLHTNLKNYVRSYKEAEGKSC
jgi:hypothetical protein